MAMKKTEFPSLEFFRFIKVDFSVSVSSGQKQMIKHGKNFSNNQAYVYLYE